MPRVLYKPTAFKPDALSVIQRANDICAQYGAQGLDLTLRQLFYQFVSRDWIPNKQTEYKRLGDIINKARYAGLLDWTYIVDRTRNLRALSHWDDVPGAMRAISEQFRIDRWEHQPTRIEVWIEKDALVGVLQAVCPDLDVPYFSCRGYTSSSEVWSAAQRLGEYVEKGQNVVVVHLGDHDPSGVDMTRDIEDRIRDFMSQDYLNAHGDEFPSNRALTRDIWAKMGERCDGREAFRLDRIALNMDQVQEYQPPPNPAKMSDSRASGYVDLYGDESWELDALDPTTLIQLITDTVEELRDDQQWELDSAAMETERLRLAVASERWEDVVELLDEDA